MHLIPAIDLRDGHCVRLLHGDFEAETRYPTDPKSLLFKYRDWGADWLHIVDLDGARGGIADNRTIILAPTGKDRQLIASLLERRGMPCHAAEVVIEPHEGPTDR